MRSLLRSWQRFWVVCDRVWNLAGLNRRQRRSFEQRVRRKRRRFRRCPVEVLQPRAMLDANPLVAIQATDASATEGTDPGQVRVWRTGDLSGSIDVVLNVGGTASPADYDGITLPVHFNADEYEKTIAITAFDERITEANETLVFTLAPGSGYDIDSTAYDATITIIDAGNDAPVLVPATANAQLAALDEDAAAGSNNGTSVRDLMPASGASDADTDTLGLAITAATTSNGTWQYSLNGGTSWTSVGTRSDSSALLLKSDDDTRIRFLPNANYNGVATFTYRLWDGTDGRANGTANVNVSTNGGATPFSAASDSAAITVIAVNDTPTVTSTVTQLSIGTAQQTLIGNRFNFSDVDSSQFTATITVDFGTLKQGSTTATSFTFSGSSSSILSSLGSLYFVAPSNSLGTAHVSLAVTDTSAGNPLSTATKTIDVRVLPRVSVSGPSGVAESAGTIVYTVTLSEASDQVVEVMWRNVIFSSESDFIGPSYGTLTFAPGATSQTLTLTVADDLLDEDDEYAWLSINSATNAVVATSTFLTTIVDNDATPTLSAATATVTVGETAVAATIRVQLSAASGRTVSVHMQPADGTATRPDDWTSGYWENEYEQVWVDTSYYVQNWVPDVWGDQYVATYTNHPYWVDDVVNSETLEVITPGYWADNWYDDWSYQYVVVTPGYYENVLVPDGHYENGAVNGGHWIDSDYLYFNPGETEKTFTIQINNDYLEEGSEYFTVQLNTVVNAILTEPSQVTVTIRDDESNTAPTVNEYLANLTLTAIDPDVDSSPNTGTSVHDLIAAAVSAGIIADAEGDALGIAVVAANSTVGTWDYSLDGGLHWTMFGGLSEYSAVLLDGDARVRFIHGANYTGHPTLTFRAWDGSDVNATGTTGVNVSVNGGHSAYSTNLGVITVNHKPTAQNKTYHYEIPHGHSGFFDPPAPTSDMYGDIDGDELTVTLGSISSNAQSFMVTDSNGASAGAVSDVTTSYQENHAPTAEDFTIATGEDQAVTFDLLAHFEDLDGDSVTLVSSPTNVSDNFNGTWTYTPDPNVNGPVTFQYTITDGWEGYATGTVTINIAAVNDAPVLDAVGFNPTLAEIDEDVDSAGNTGTLVRDLISPTSYPGYAADVDNDLLGLAIIAAETTNGTWEYSAAGGAWTSFSPSDSAALLLWADDYSRIRFVPNADWSGPATIGYRLWDRTVHGNGTIVNIGTVFAADAPFSAAADSAVITVNSMNDAPVAATNGSYAISVHHYATTYVGSLGGGGGTDVDGDNVTISYPGTIPVTPNSSMPVTFYVSDGQVTSEGTIWLTVNVDPNLVPTAAAYSTSTNEETALSFNPLTTYNPQTGGYLAADGDGDPLTVSIVPTNGYELTKGTASVDPSGNITYTPNADAVGTDTFRYQVADNYNGIAEAVVTVTINNVNDAPTLTTGDYYVPTDEDVPVTFNPFSSAAPFDVDGDSLYVSGVTGSATFDSYGNITYTPGTNANGPDSIQFTVSDGQGGSATATLHITINPVNDAPVAAAGGTYSILVHHSVTTYGGPLGGGSATDVEDGSVWNITYPTSISLPVGGGLTSFDFTATDSGGLSTVGSVALTVSVAPNVAPTAESFSIDVTEDTPYVFNPSAGYTGDADGDARTVVSVSGNAVVDAYGNITYTPAPNANGSDSFQYTVSDGYGDTATATVYVNIIPVNDAPVAATGGTYTISVNHNADTYSGPLGGGSATDVEDGSVSNISYPTSISVPVGGGTTSFDFTATDSGGLSISGTVALTVNVDANVAPTAGNLTIDVTEDTPYTFSPLSATADADGDTRTITSVTGAAVLNSDGTITYTPAANSTAPDSFQYTVSDGYDGSATATVSVNITPVNDAPVFAPYVRPTLTSIDEDIASADNTGTLVRDLVNELSYVSEVDGDALGLVITGVDTADGIWQFSLDDGEHWTDLGLPSDNSAVVLYSDNETRLRFVPGADYHGTPAFTYRLWDRTGGYANGASGVSIYFNGGTTPFSTDYDTAWITVNSINDRPTLSTNVGVVVDEGESVTIAATLLRVTDVDDVDSNLKYTLDEIPTAGMLTLNGVTLGEGATFTQSDLNEGRLAYQHRIAGFAEDSFTFTVADAVGGALDGTAAERTFHIAIMPSLATQYAQDEAQTIDDEFEDLLNEIANEIEEGIADALGAAGGTTVDPSIGMAADDIDSAQEDAVNDAESEAHTAADEVANAAAAADTALDEAQEAISNIRDSINEDRFSRNDAAADAEDAASTIEQAYDDGESAAPLTDTSEDGSLSSDSEDIDDLSQQAGEDAQGTATAAESAADSRHDSVDSAAGLAHGDNMDRHDPIRDDLEDELEIRVDDAQDAADQIRDEVSSIKDDGSAAFNAAGETEAVAIEAGASDIQDNIAADQVDIQAAFDDLQADAEDRLDDIRNNPLADIDLDPVDEVTAPTPTSVSAPVIDPWTAALEEEAFLGILPGLQVALHPMLQNFHPGDPDIDLYKPILITGASMTAVGDLYHTATFSWHRTGQTELGGTYTLDETIIVTETVSFNLDGTFSVIASWDVVALTYHETGSLAEWSTSSSSVDDDIVFTSTEEGTGSYVLDALGTYEIIVTSSGVYTISGDGISINATSFSVAQNGGYSYTYQEDRTLVYADVTFGIGSESSMATETTTTNIESGDYVFEQTDSGSYAITPTSVSMTATYEAEAAYSFDIDNTKVSFVEGASDSTNDDTTFNSTTSGSTNVHETGTAGAEFATSGSFTAAGTQAAVTMSVAAVNVEWSTSRDTTRTTESETTTATTSDTDRTDTSDGVTSTEFSHIETSEVVETEGTEERHQRSQTAGAYTLEAATARAATGVVTAKLSMVMIDATYQSSDLSDSLFTTTVIQTYSEESESTTSFSLDDMTISASNEVESEESSIDVTTDDDQYRYFAEGTVNQATKSVWVGALRSAYVVKSDTTGSYLHDEIHHTSTTRDGESYLKIDSHDEFETSGDFEDETNSIEVHTTRTATSHYDGDVVNNYAETAEFVDTTAKGIRDGAWVTIERNETSGGISAGTSEESTSYSEEADTTYTSVVTYSLMQIALDPTDDYEESDITHRSESGTTITTSESTYASAEMADFDSSHASVKVDGIFEQGHDQSTWSTRRGSNEETGRIVTTESSGDIDREISSTTGTEDDGYSLHETWNADVTRFDESGYADKFMSVGSVREESATFLPKGAATVRTSSSGNDAGPDLDYSHTHDTSESSYSEEGTHYRKASANNDIGSGNGTWQSDEREGDYSLLDADQATSDIYASSSTTWSSDFISSDDAILTSSDQSHSVSKSYARDELGKIDPIHHYHEAGTFVTTTENTDDVSTASTNREGAFTSDEKMYSHQVVVEAWRDTSDSLSQSIDSELSARASSQAEYYSSDLAHDRTTTEATESGTINDTRSDGEGTSISVEATEDGTYTYSYSTDDNAARLSASSGQQTASNFTFEGVSRDVSTFDYTGVTKGSATYQEASSDHRDTTSVLTFNRHDGFTSETTSPTIHNYDRAVASEDGYVTVYTESNVSGSIDGETVVSLHRHAVAEGGGIRYSYASSQTQEHFDITDGHLSADGGSPRESQEIDFTETSNSDSVRESVQFSTISSIQNDIELSQASSWGATQETGDQATYSIDTETNNRHETGTIKRYDPTDATRAPSEANIEATLYSTTELVDADRHHFNSHSTSASSGLTDTSTYESTAAGASVHTESNDLTNDSLEGGDFEARTPPSGSGSAYDTSSGTYSLETHHDVATDQIIVTSYSDIAKVAKAGVDTSVDSRHNQTTTDVFNADTSSQSSTYTADGTFDVGPSNDNRSGTNFHRLVVDTGSSDVYETYRQVDDERSLDDGLTSSSAQTSTTSDGRFSSELTHDSNSEFHEEGDAAYGNPGAEIVWEHHFVLDRTRTVSELTIDDHTYEGTDRYWSTDGAGTSESKFLSTFRIGDPLPDEGSESDAGGRYYSDQSSNETLNYTITNGEGSSLVNDDADVPVDADSTFSFTESGTYGVRMIDTHDYSLAIDTQSRDDVTETLDVKNYTGGRRITLSHQEYTSETNSEIAHDGGPSVSIDAYSVDLGVILGGFGDSPIFASIYSEYVGPDEPSGSEGPRWYDEPRNDYPLTDSAIVQGSAAGHGTIWESALHQKIETSYDRDAQSTYSLDHAKFTTDDPAAPESDVSIEHFEETSDYADDYTSKVLVATAEQKSSEGAPAVSAPTTSSNRRAATVFSDERRATDSGRTNYSTWNGELDGVQFEAYHIEVELGRFSETGSQTVAYAILDRKDSETSSGVPLSGGAMLRTETTGADTRTTTIGGVFGSDEFISYEAGNERFSTLDSSRTTSIAIDEAVVHHSDVHNTSGAHGTGADFSSETIETRNKTAGYHSRGTKEEASRSFSEYGSDSKSSEMTSYRGSVMTNLSVTGVASWASGGAAEYDAGGSNPEDDYSLESTRSSTGEAALIQTTKYQIADDSYESSGTSGNFVHYVNRYAGTYKNDQTQSGSGSYSLAVTLGAEGHDETKHSDESSSGSFTTVFHQDVTIQARNVTQTGMADIRDNIASGTYSASGSSTLTDEGNYHGPTDHSDFHNPHDGVTTILENKRTDHLTTTFSESSTYVTNNGVFSQNYGGAERTVHQKTTGDSTYDDGQAEHYVFTYDHTADVGFTLTGVSGSSTTTATHEDDWIKWFEKEGEVPEGDDPYELRPGSEVYGGNNGIPQTVLYPADSQSYWNTANAGAVFGWGRVWMRSSGWTINGPYDTVFNDARLGNFGLALPTMNSAFSSLPSTLTGTNVALPGDAERGAFGAEASLVTGRLPSFSENPSPLTAAFTILPPSRTTLVDQQGSVDAIGGFNTTIGAHELPYNPSSPTAGVFPGSADIFPIGSNVGPPVASVAVPQHGSQAAATTVLDKLPLNALEKMVVKGILKMLRDDQSLDPRYRQIVTGILDVLTVDPTEIGDFAWGVLQGFLYYGLLDDIKNVFSLTKFTARASAQFSEPLRWLYKSINGEEPLAPEIRAFKAALETLAVVWPLVEKLMVKGAGNAFLKAMTGNDPAAIEAYGPAAKALRAAGYEVLLNLLVKLNDVPAETMGIINGVVLWNLALAAATDGLAVAAKMGKLCGIFLKAQEWGLPKHIATTLQKVANIVLRIIDLNICFVAGTLVHTPEGPRPIESLRIGDWVLCRSEHDAQADNCYRRVLETIVTNPAELLHLEFEVDGIREALVGTTCHPFYSVDRNEFVVAEQLLVGDRLALADGRIATVVSLSREAAPAGRAFTTFNLSVAEHRTYFVGQAAVWVHNMSQGGELCNLEPLLKKFGDALVKGTKESIEAFADQIVPMLKALPDNSKVPEALKEIQDALRKIPELPMGKIDEIFDAIRKKLDDTAPGNVFGKLVNELDLPKDAQRALLREAMGTLGTGKVAHHLIPLEAITKFKDLMQKAARGGFNMNGKNNGIALLKDIEHVGGHPGYNQIVLEELGEIARRSKGLSDAAVAELVQDAANTLRTAIKSGRFGPSF